MCMRRRGALLTEEIKMQAVTFRAIDTSKAAGSINQLQAERAFAFGSFLCLLQAADGWLTSVGMARFGTSMEGNPLLRALMEQLGHVPALTIVKLLAIVVVVLLTIQAKRKPWVGNAMGALSCIYVFLAIVPWTYLLFVKPYLA